MRIVGIGSSVQTPTNYIFSDRIDLSFNNLREFFGNFPINREGVILVVRFTTYVVRPVHHPTRLDNPLF